MINTMYTEGYDLLDSIFKNAACASTGFSEIDSILGPVVPGELVVIGSRPCHGKTTMMLEIMSHLALEKNMSVALFENEMSMQDVLKRLLAQEATVPASLIRKGEPLSREAWEDVAAACDMLSSGRIWISDSCFELNEIKTTCMDLFENNNGPEAIFIDNLQSLYIKGCRYSNRYEELAAISRSLKQFAAENNTIIFVSSQISRNAEKLPRSVLPRLHDLSESGSVEQIADVVIMLQNNMITASEDELWNIDNIFDVGLTVSIGIPKNRYGDTVESLKYPWIPRYCKISKQICNREMRYRGE